MFHGRFSVLISQLVAVDNIFFYDDEIHVELKLRAMTADEWTKLPS